MAIRCKVCHRPVQTRFHHGSFHFNHCGRAQSVPARDRGQAKQDQSGTWIGAALGTLGAAAAAVNPLGGLVIGALMGSALNSDNHRRCHRCGSAAYPTGKRGSQGDPMYHCSNSKCRAYVFVRSR